MGYVQSGPCREGGHSTYITLGKLVVGVVRQWQERVVSIVDTLGHARRAEVVVGTRGVCAMEAGSNAFALAKVTSGSKVN